MGIEIQEAADRFRPGADRFPTTKNFGFTVAASAIQVLRAIPAGSSPGGGRRYIAFRVTADAHILFGDGSALGLPDPTNTDPLYTAADGWQEYTLGAYDTHFKIKGDAGSGTIYLFWC